GNSWKTDVSAGQSTKCRVDGLVVAVWESRASCGRPLCPHTSSTEMGCSVHTNTAVVHSYPQNGAQGWEIRCVHRLCTRMSVHIEHGKTAQESTGPRSGCVVVAGRRAPGSRGCHNPQRSEEHTS